MNALEMNYYRLLLENIYREIFYRGVYYRNTLEIMLHKKWIGNYVIKRLY